ncbi:MAG: translation initiation factor IF-3 [Chloroflexota bacterium]|nr:MAG: translation initiation factor IF-3 [Chloroflexota bacterium]
MIPKANLYVTRWSLISVRDLRINDKIRVRDVRLIGDEGEQLGIVATIEAMRMAVERGIDLVEVAPTAVPPVCRLMDYGRFKYEQTKREREAKKNQKVVELKEVRMTPRTDEHDVMAKVKTIQRFLDEGDKVKVTIRFRGRELAHPQLGRQVLDQVAEQLKTTSTIERPPLMEGRAMFMIMAAPGARSVAAQPARPPGMAEPVRPPAVAVPTGPGGPPGPVPNGPVAPRIPPGNGAIAARPAPRMAPSDPAAPPRPADPRRA